SSGTEIEVSMDTHLYENLLIDDKVGIGTTSPTHELQVVGDVNITDDLFVRDTVHTHGTISAEHASGVSGGLADYVGMGRWAGVFGDNGTTGDYAGYFRGDVYITGDLYSASESAPWQKAIDIYNTTDIDLLKKIETHNKTNLPAEFYKEEEILNEKTNKTEVKTAWNIWEIIKLMQGAILGNSKEVQELKAEVQELKIENQLIKDELCQKDPTYSWCKVLEQI
ncbi:MAG: hypothetical protein ACTSVB_04425, partial [Candidatus Heimdallarchaeaceae archaeon]